MTRETSDTLITMDPQIKTIKVCVTTTDLLNPLFFANYKRFYGHKGTWKNARSLSFLFRLHSFLLLRIVHDSMMSLERERMSWMQTLCMYACQKRDKMINYSRKRSYSFSESSCGTFMHQFIIGFMERFHVIYYSPRFLRFCYE